MSDVLVQGGAGIFLAAVAVVLAWRLGLGLSKELAVAAIRAVVQLTVVGAVIVVIFEVPALAFAFVAVMLTTAAFTAGRRIKRLPNARVGAFTAIAIPALLATGFLLGVGAFDVTPRAAVPTAGILIGGAMAATSLTGRRLTEELDAAHAEIEARLCLGDSAREALRPSIRRAIHTALTPAIDQTRSVGLVTLPGAFVGLLLGGAKPEEAASTQLVVLLSLLAVELAAAALLAEFVQRAAIAPGERVRRLSA
ncbi:putative ABC transport system permease protein [Solirubrobacter pauli]|uniref:Putative ABC transport system permease protein n=1 Tax=Solirubrobacter pauli TaxID=166793 RepID=A0A660LA80_9ACTN|nr:ABC transporter permease [Solirubrobacter pauli]RKQ92007.1 putative ABC transport system permease protein [Solirubrobacter pauli]